MTITYTGKVANARLCSFSRLLFYWRGSIYKLVYKEMFIFCGMYATISLIYRLSLKDEYKRTFEKISLYCKTFTDLIPMSFILGFYVSIVVTRWWSQYMKIPWPDRMMMYLTGCLDGVDEFTRILRRTMVRYLTLGSLLVFQSTAVSVKKRFPTIDHLIEAGVLMPKEAKELDEVQCPHGKWWIPFLWVVNMLKDARKEGRISDNYMYKCLLDEVMSYRGSLGELYSYDWISVPLVYTQVTTLAVYMFFLGALFGQQFLDPAQNYPGHSVDLYFPFFTLMQFFFYMGWLKVAEQLINPFGEDDDDFEMNWIIDRNMQLSLLAVDDLYGQYPSIEKDMYFGEPPPEYLPYTKSSISTKIDAHMGSMADLNVSSDGMRTVNPMETIQEGVTFRSSNLRIPRGQSHMDSPIGSPWKARRLHQNMVSGIRTPFSISKLTMDGTNIEAQTGREGKFLVQPVEGSLESKAMHMEAWLNLQDKKERADSKLAASAPTESLILRDPSICSGLKLPNSDSLIFAMDDETVRDGEPDSKKTCIQCKTLTPINGTKIPKAGPLSRSRSLSAGQKALLRITSKASSTKAIDQQTASKNNEVVVQVSEPFAEDIARSRHTSSSDDSSIEYSYYYPRPDTNQRTVDSLTPLLKD